MGTVTSEVFLEYHSVLEKSFLCCFSPVSVCRRALDGAGQLGSCAVTAGSGRVVTWGTDGTEMEVAASTNAWGSSGPGLQAL